MSMEIHNQIDITPCEECGSRMYWQYQTLVSENPKPGCTCGQHYTPNQLEEELNDEA